jgi:uncharacterized membrane protein required for colicin V production
VKGLVWQLAWIGAIVLCFVFSQTGSMTIAGWLPIEPPLNRWVAMFLLYLAAAFVAFAVAAKLHGWIEKAKFKELDKHLGAVFGLLKGTLISLVVIFFAVTLTAATREPVLQSHSGYVAALIMDRLRPVLPEELHGVLLPYLYHLDEAGGEPAQKEDSPVDGKTIADPAKRPGGQTDIGALRRALMEKITAVYKSEPQDRPGFLKEMESRLADIPADVALSVLRDWDADVRLQKPDPEPATDSLTSLAKRIRIHTDRIDPLRQPLRSAIDLDDDAPYYVPGPESPLFNQRRALEENMLDRRKAEAGNAAESLVLCSLGLLGKAAADVWASTPGQSLPSVDFLRDDVKYKPDRQKAAFGERASRQR